MSLLSVDEQAARERWLLQRKHGLGGSDAASAAGVDPYRDALTLWSEKVGLIEPADLSKNEAVEAGNALERAIGEWYGKRHGRDVTLGVPFQLLRSHKWPWMFATLDATQVIDGETGVVQIKNTSFAADAWEESLPVGYEIQLTHEMLVAGVTRGTLVALHRGQQLRAYDRVLNTELADALVAAEAKFWSLVEAETPPEAGPNSTDAIKKLFPRVEVADLVALGHEIDDADAELEGIRGQIGTLESRKDEIENRIKLLIGSHAGGVTPQGTRFTWNGSEVHHKPREASVSYVRRFLRSKAR
jgi:putative phage-type endonuclease